MTQPTTDYVTRRLAEITGKERPRPIAAPAPREREPIATTFLPTLWAIEALKEARKRARARGLEFRLDVQWATRQLEQQGYACAISGIPFSTNRTRAKSHKRPFMPSLDRKDCDRGYTKDNVRIVCVAVNTLLQDWGDEVFHVLIAASRK